MRKNTLHRAVPVTPVRTILLQATLLGCLSLSAIPASTAPQQEQAPTGQSAVAAAKLKKNAPGWVQHYLPDDRYKVAGGIWKYVSSDEDGLYHSPRCSTVLGQSADAILGFASSGDADEAGYRPDTACVAPAVPSPKDGSDSRDASNLLSQAEASYEKRKSSNFAVSDSEAIRRYNIAWERYLVKFEAWKDANREAGYRFTSLRNAILRKQARGLKVSDEDRQALGEAKSTMQQVHASLPQPPEAPRAYQEYLKNNYGTSAILSSYRRTRRR